MHGQKHPRDRDIAELAGRQHGVVAYWQLIAIGFGRGAIDHRVATGSLHPFHKGVYAVGHSAIGYMGRWMAGVLACGPEAVLSHQNAAALLGLRPMSSSAVHVTVPGRTRRGPRGITVHRVRSLHADDCWEEEGIPVTSLARTLLDLAEVLPPRQLIRAIEQAERLQVFDLNAIEQLLARGPGRHGTKPLRAVLAEIDGEPPKINSDWERDFLDFCQDHGLPPPELNVIVEGYEVDALWRDQKLIVELDSWGSHRSRPAFEQDRVKDAALQLTGYRVLRITWRRLENEPAAVAATVRAFLG
jgi:hypothetical protein